MHGERRPGLGASATGVQARDDSQFLAQVSQNLRTSVRLGSLKEEAE